MKESMNSGFYDSFQIQRKREKIQNMAHQYADYLCTAVDNAEDDEIIELDEFLHSFSGLKNGENSLNDIEKIKFFLSVPRISSDTSDVISSYIESSVYGWQDNKYVLSNRCLRENSASHCKNISRIANVTDAEHVMGDISEIFLDEEYGSISTLIFSYCISALFASKLNRDHCTPPFYLQIACDRESAFYQLVEELVDMCDINSGLLDRCALLDSKYRSCHSSNHKYYPSPSLDRDLNELLRDNRDTPVIISGFESGRSYGALLRKIVNMSNKTRNLELRDRFNVIPLFMGKELVSDYDNVLSLDLTNFDIEHSYLHLVRKRKKFLASLVFELVENYEKYLLTNEVGISSPKQQRFFRAIGSYALSVEKENSKLPLRVARNIGFLEFFFSGLMNAFSDLCAAFREEKFTVFETPNGQPAPATVRENTVRFTDLVENTLVKLHRQYLPDPTETDIKDQDAAKLAKKSRRNIMNCIFTSALYLPR